MAKYEKTHHLEKLTDHVLFGFDGEPKQYFIRTLKEEVFNWGDVSTYKTSICLHKINDDKVVQMSQSSLSIDDLLRRCNHFSNRLDKLVLNNDWFLYKLIPAEVKRGLQFKYKDDKKVYTVVESSEIVKGLLVLDIHDYKVYSREHCHLLNFKTVEEYNEYYKLAQIEVVREAE